MSQDKEYIPEWKQPHIGSEAKKKYVTFEHEGWNNTIRKKIIGTVTSFNGQLEIRDKGRNRILIITSNKEEIKELHQSILNQLNQ